LKAALVAIFQGWFNQGMHWKDRKIGQIKKKRMKGESVASIEEGGDEGLAAAMRSPGVTCIPFSKRHQAFAKPRRAWPLPPPRCPPSLLKMKTWVLFQAQLVQPAYNGSQLTVFVDLRALATAQGPAGAGRATAGRE
jgi:hypothetical protein